jgi:hypothetical protein
MKVVEKIKKNSFYVRNSFENCIICEILRKNMVEAGRPQMTV